MNINRKSWSQYNLDNPYFTINFVNLMHPRLQIMSLSTLSTLNLFNGPLGVELSHPPNPIVLRVGVGVLEKYWSHIC